MEPVAVVYGCLLCDASYVDSEPGAEVVIEGVSYGSSPDSIPCPNCDGEGDGDE